MMTMMTMMTHELICRSNRRFGRSNWSMLVVCMVIAASFVMLPASVQAQENGGQDQNNASEANQIEANKKKAKAYYDKGVKAFFEKNFPEAITYFQRAHSLDPDPVQLYNISLAYSKMGNAADALTAALEAQKVGGLPKDTAFKNQFRIIGYRRVIVAKSVTEAINPPKAQVSEDTTDAQDADKPAVKRPDNAQDRGLSTVGWAGLGTAGLGAGALVGAGVLNFIVAGNMDEYDTARADGDYGRASGLYSDIGDRQDMGRVLLYSGAGLVAVGGALFAYDYFGSTETTGSADQASVFGAVDSDGVNVQVRWAF
jgi:tetratricopeptide (TPR) repeat protein